MPVYPKKAQRDAARAQAAKYTGRGADYRERSKLPGGQVPAPAGAAPARAPYMVDSKIPYDVPGIISYLALKYGYVDMDVFEGLETDERGVPVLEEFPLDPVPAMEEVLEEVNKKYGGGGGDDSDSDAEDAGAGSGPPRPAHDQQAIDGEAVAGGRGRGRNKGRGGSTAASKADRHEKTIYMPPDSTIVNFGMRRCVLIPP